MLALQIYQTASYFSTSGFVATVLLNTALVLLTVYHLKRIHKTYRNLIVIFAIISIIFSIIEMLVHPFYHSYNAGFICFNMVKWVGWSEDLVTVLVASYSGVYLSMVSFFTVLFMFRYWTMISSPLVDYFEGYKILILMIWPLFFGFMVAGVVLYIGAIDSYSRDYFRDVMLEQYELEMYKVSGFAVVAYDQDEQLRWSAVAFCFGVIFLMEIQFAIVGYCGFQMHFKMNDLSEAHRRLQMQFFKSLVLQITSPTLTFYIPAVAIMLVPFFNLKLSIPSGLIVCSFSIYPPLDSLILMLIVSDYRNAIRGIFKQPSSLFGSKVFTGVAAPRAMMENAWN
ncbi:hypothetical protein L5515_007085 [Caenorhabditis briggsae]|uniref:Seven TM Receptor n=1 Tax=Caenorhabditis briggsae TaxID=6238 RepID=A0AAE9JKA9_CAEBR|nr:hypothetical protein L5515_007085 [Caenorhabditis briggsae]